MCFSSIYKNLLIFPSKSAVKANIFSGQTVRAVIGLLCPFKTFDTEPLSKSKIFMKPERLTPTRKTFVQMIQSC